MSNLPAAPEQDRTWDERDGRDSWRLETPPLTLRLRVAAGRGRLTRELAEGADPASSPQLALRAAQLTSHRGSRQLVRTLESTIREANSPPPRPHVVIINRRAVLIAEDAIEAVIARLTSAEPVRAQGMAIVERMITNAEESPLYASGEPEALRRRTLVALEALDAGHHEERKLATAA